MVMLLSLARRCGWCVICLQSTTMWRLQRVSVSWWRDWRRSYNSNVFSGKHNAGKVLAAVLCILRGEEPTVVVVKVLLYVHRNRRLIRDGKPRMSTSTFTQLLSSESQLLIIIIIETFVMIIIGNFCRALFSDVHRLHFTTFSDISLVKWGEKIK